MRHHAALLETDDIGHGFFSRAGGVSTGIFSSLNCGPNSEDDPDAVAENRARVLKKLHAEHNPLVTLPQLHSADVVTVTAPWLDKNERPQADAMVTRNRNIALGILTADCCPILLADHETGVIGAVHAGWRGALAGVIPNTIKALRDIGAKIGNLRAAIGPTIQQASYEVGAEVRDAFTAANVNNGKFFLPSPANTSSFMFDLPGFAATSLMASGVQLFENLALDTYPAGNDFFSYRRRTHENDKGPVGSGNYGRQISVITLR